jgi:5-(aminomethyl)-3-furanmethanol phosphate kinase
MIVIKLGGSLVESGGLLKCLNTVEQKYQGRAVVIVPGGGEFAEQVRRSQKRWRFDDKTAHYMAILAMQQMALLFKALKNDFVIVDSLQAIRSHLIQQKILIWSPDIRELDQAKIPATWDITSDSLAAWLAKALSAQELILVKSAAIDENLSSKEITEKNIVDRAFFAYVSQASFQLQLIHKDSFY